MASMIALASTLLRLLLGTLASALSPPSCAACDARLGKRAVFCVPCAAAIEPPADPGGPVSFAAYGGPLAVALRRLKYENRPDLGAPLGHLARRAAREAGLTADLVVPVPLHPTRLAERGYNQAALLAAEVAVELRAPLAARALTRLRPTAPQARLDRKDRLGNMIDAFRARRPSAIQGRRVVLVDDVATTGATLAACESALYAAGARSVTAVVVARA
jgi:ComF family protein